MRAAVLAAGLLLAACSQGSRDPAPRSSEETAAEAPRDDVYVARYEAPPLAPGAPPPTARLALFHGTWGVVNDCLVFDAGGDEPALVRLPIDTPVDVYSDRVVIGGTEHPFGVQETRGGGYDGANGHDLLVTPPPADCAYSVIGP